MKQTNWFLNDMLDFDDPGSQRSVLWPAGVPREVEAADNGVLLKVPFYAQKRDLVRADDEEDTPVRFCRALVRAYGDSIVRVSFALADGFPGDESVMLEWDDGLLPESLSVEQHKAGWRLVDSAGRERLSIDTSPIPTKQWRESFLGQHEPIVDAFNAVVLPDGRTKVPFMQFDKFYGGLFDSLPLAFIERQGEEPLWCYSLHAAPNERFAGTGERFTPMNLSGQTMILENDDGAGSNSRRAYKNIPFYVSSRPYGLLLLTSSHIRLSLAGMSTRAAQGRVDDGVLDMFFFGGGSLERILHNYRRVTGFPRNVPLWSYGTWMSRMTYFSADETREIAGKLRAGKFPCDVIHLDSGWFPEDAKCQWKFSPERFPDPAKYMAQMRADGFRVTLWQTPNLCKGTDVFEEAKENRYIGVARADSKSTSDFGDVRYGGCIDFSNPEAVAWYQGMIKRLLRIGASAIKTDFGEVIEMKADYHGMPAAKLHNLYSLLYQKACYEACREVNDQAGADTVIWARAGWTGCQRYPVHWAGDPACSWDGLAGCIRGGLHLGLSGFAFWSHDVPGFHGIGDFMANWPTPTLYLRWTQTGVFTSHLRYHGAHPREPYEYPEVADLVREWLKLRYGLIPYIKEQGDKAIASGLPVLRAMIFHHEQDPRAWFIDDQYYFGDDLLIAPVMNDQGVRDVYLPEGEWVDFWTGRTLTGPAQLKDVASTLKHIPVYARKGSAIPVYPQEVQCTDEIDLDKAVRVRFDGTYKGIAASVLGSYVAL